MEGGPWLHYYLTEIAAGHWERAADLTRASTGNPRAAVIDTLKAARAQGALDRAAAARLTLEGDCAVLPNFAALAARHGVTEQSLVGYRLGRAWVVLTIVGPPDWFNFVAANLEGK